jgi:hypothetical protein
MTLESSLSSAISRCLEAYNLGCHDSNFLDVMAAKSRTVSLDIPAFFELASLILLGVEKAGVTPATLSSDLPPLLTSQAVHYDADGLRGVALLTIPAGGLEYVLHWGAASLQSPKVKALPGVLALPFSVESRNDTQYVLPDWFAAYYVDGDPEKCVPLLTLKAMLDHEGMAGDWVDVALQRMPLYRLPQTKATQAVSTQPAN